MPKPIRKKIKPASKPETADIESLLDKMKDVRVSYGKRLMYAAIGVAAAIAVIAGIAFYKSSAQKNSAKFQYEGYKLYYGLYGTKPLAYGERYRLALENFKKAYSERESAMSLYYIAGAQYALGDYNAAVESLSSLEKKFGSDAYYVPLARYKKATAYMKTGKVEDALKTLDALYGSGTEAYRDFALIEAARILEDAGRAEEAKAKYAKLAKEFPNSPFVNTTTRPADVANAAGAP